MPFGFFFFTVEKHNKILGQETKVEFKLYFKFRQFVLLLHEKLEDSSNINFSHIEQIKVTVGMIQRFF